MYHKRSEEDCTLEHGEMQHDLARLLKPTQCRTPIFYKMNNPGRPVISSGNNHAEKISAYVDEFLRPTAEQLHFYIRDTTDFMQGIVSGRLPVECYLVTFDISSLYTNIDIDEGLMVVQEELIKTNWSKPSPQTLTCLLEKVLRLNNFTFNDEQFIQIKGTAMGSGVAPNFANVYIGRIEGNFVYKTEWSNNVVIWVRFTDDIFLKIERGRRLLNEIH